MACTHTMGVLLSGSSGPTVKKCHYTRQLTPTEKPALRSIDERVVSAFRRPYTRSLDENSLIERFSANLLKHKAPPWDCRRNVWRRTTYPVSTGEREKRSRK